MARDKFRRVKGDGPMVRRKPKAAKVKPLKTGEIALPPGAIPSPSGGKSPALDFATALMQGNPEAMRMAEEALRSNVSDDKEKPALADMFVSETYSIGKRLALNANQMKRVEPILASYRADLRQAHRFVLDDDFVRFATEVGSTISPAKLLARIQYATIPYQTTWLEFNLKVKVRTMRAIHGMDDSKFKYNEVADRLGLIIKRLSDTEATIEIVCETFGDYGLIGTTICYFFSTKEYDFTYRDKRWGCTPMIISDKLRQKIHEAGVDDEVVQVFADDRMTSIGSGSLWGYSAEGADYKSTVIESIKQMRSLALPVFLMRHGCLGTGRMREIIQAAFVGGIEKDAAETISQLMLSETTEFTGMMRWIVVVLAMLNEVPISTQHMEPQGSIRTGLTGRRPYMDYHKVTLRVPKTRPVQYIERQFRQAARRRAHEVRAHWRTYLHEVRCKPDEHEWEYDHNEGYRLCGKCMAYGRLIHEHVRGDPSLGWVNKQYVVKRERQT